MSTTRQPQLPPRCPMQKKPNSSNQTVPRADESYARHRKSSSHSSTLEEQPPWLEDLLTDEESNVKGTMLRRSASDSITLLDGLADSLKSLTVCKDKEYSVGNDTSNGLDSESMYGPNSPRQRCNSGFSENAIVSALSKFLPQENFSVSDITCLDAKGELFHSADINSETIAIKRHSGQRSRVRKLQYIAELERTVKVLQTLESELSVRVASLLQQRVALLMENQELDQQATRLQREKLAVEGQYQSLKKEVERLKSTLQKIPESKLGMYSGSSPSQLPNWQMLDMGKLNLN